MFMFNFYQPYTQHSPPPLIFLTLSSPYLTFSFSLFILSSFFLLQFLTICLCFNLLFPFILSSLNLLTLFSPYPFVLLLFQIIFLHNQLHFIFFITKYSFFLLYEVYLSKTHIFYFFLFILLIYLAGIAKYAHPSYYILCTKV